MFYIFYIVFIVFVAKSKCVGGSSIFYQLFYGLGGPPLLSLSTVSKSLHVAVEAVFRSRVELTSLLIVSDFHIS